jgi:hypothetical protein
LCNARLASRVLQAIFALLRAETCFTVYAPSSLKQAYRKCSHRPLGRYLPKTELYYKNSRLFLRERKRGRKLGGYSYFGGDDDDDD